MAACQVSPELDELHYLTLENFLYQTLSELFDPSHNTISGESPDAIDTLTKEDDIALGIIGDGPRKTDSTAKRIDHQC